MSITAGDMMRTDVLTVSPEMTIPELEQKLNNDNVGGFPVVDDLHRLVGMVSRSDVIRQICLERNLVIADGDLSMVQEHPWPIPLDMMRDVADLVGEHVDAMHVKDVMNRKIVSVEPDRPVEEVARLMVQNWIHRLPVTTQGRLVGIITTMDFVQLVAANRLRSE